MARVNLPELPVVVANLVRGGVYSIYAVKKLARPYVLVTKDGTLYEVSDRGKVLDALSGKRLKNVEVQEAVTLDGSSVGASITV